MDMQKYITVRNIKIAAVVTVVICVLLLVMRAGSVLQFRVTGVSPKPKTLPTSTRYITVDFNRELAPVDKQPEGFVNLFPEVPILTKIEGKRLTVTFLTEMVKDSDVSLSLNKITSEDGDTVTTKLEYVVKYVQYNKLSQEERDRQTAMTGRPQDRNPLLSKLPHDEIAFRINYFADEDTFGTADSWQGEKDHYVVTINTYTLKDGVPLETYAEKNRALRKLALDWIREQGVNPDTDINISFTPNDEELGGAEQYTGDGTVEVADPTKDIGEPIPNEHSTILIDDGEGHPTGL